LHRWEAANAGDRFRKNGQRHSNVNTSRVRAFRAPAPSARYAEQVSAPPASRSRVQRLARQLVDEEQFDHLARSLRLIRQSFDCRGK
jgi:hypothetical protein